MVGVPIGPRHSSQKTQRSEEPQLSTADVPEVVFTEAEEGGPSVEAILLEAERAPSRKRKRSKGKEKVGAKRSKKGKGRKRETLFRTKVRRQLLKEYHKLVARRKAINKKIRDNRRHRNQLIFHRLPQ